MLIVFSFLLWASPPPPACSRSPEGCASNLVLLISSLGADQHRLLVASKTVATSLDTFFFLSYGCRPTFPPLTHPFPTSAENAEHWFYFLLIQRFQREKKVCFNQLRQLGHLKTNWILNPNVLWGYIKKKIQTLILKKKNTDVELIKLRILQKIIFK